MQRLAIQPARHFFDAGAGRAADESERWRIGRRGARYNPAIAAGHFLRPWIGAFVARHRAALGFVDRGSILLVVYLAFSEAVANGIWHVLGLADLVKLVVVCALLLAIVLGVTVIVARRLGFNRADEIVIVFCGSKKSLASGVPMAGVLFPLAQVGMIVLPLMLFHQIQLMVCAALARRYAASDPAAHEIAEPTQPARVG
jgi:sodium/bile acid cotransporter 7